MREFQVVFDFGVGRFSFVVRALVPSLALAEAEQLLVLSHGLVADECRRVVVCRL